LIVVLLIVAARGHDHETRSLKGKEWRREGELTFQLGDDLVTRSAGELAFTPCGAPHT
jgi:hypothetical protein